MPGFALSPVLLALQALVRPLERRFTTRQEEAAAATGISTDLIGRLRVLKGLGAEEPATERFRAASRRSLATSLRASRLDAVHEGLHVGVTGLLLAAVAFQGVRLAATGAFLARARASERRVEEVLGSPAAGELLGAVACARKTGVPMTTF